MLRRPLPYREAKRRLAAAGFLEVSQRGSHVKFVRIRGAEILTRLCRDTAALLLAPSEAFFAKRAFRSRRLNDSDRQARRRAIFGFKPGRPNVR